MRSRGMRLVIASLSIVLVLLPFESRAFAGQASNDSTLPAVVDGFISAMNTLGKFFRCQKDTAKRELLIKRLNRLSDRVKILATNTDNFRDSLFDSQQFDVDRALDNIAGVQRNLAEVKEVLNTIISDLNVQDKLPATELNIQLVVDTGARGVILRSIQTELSKARNGGKVNLEAIQKDAERALAIAQKLQLEIAGFLQTLRSNPVDC